MTYTLAHLPSIPIAASLEMPISLIRCLVPYQGTKLWSITGHVPAYMDTDPIQMSKCHSGMEVWLRCVIRICPHFLKNLPFLCLALELISMSTQCKHKQLFPSVVSTSRRKQAVGEMPSKRLLIKRKRGSEGPVLGSVFILAEL